MKRRHDGCVVFSGNERSGPFVIRLQKRDSNAMERRAVQRPWFQRSLPRAVTTRHMSRLAATGGTRLMARTHRAGRQVVTALRRR